MSLEHNFAPPKAESVSKWRKYTAAALCGLTAVAGAMEIAAPGWAKPSSQPDEKQLIAKDVAGHAVIRNKARLLIGSGWLSSSEVKDARALGINTFLTRKQGTDQGDVYKSADSQDLIVPEYSERNLQRWNSRSNTIGYVQSEDEADDKSIEPSRLPQTERASKTGKLIFQTLTYRLLNDYPNPEGISDADYKAYMDNADVVLTTVYSDAYRLSRSSVYDAITDARKLANDPNKIFGEWLNTGPISGEAGPTPAAARAEAWAVAAAGGTAYFWFMPGMKVTPAMAAAIKQTNQELQKFSDVILSPRQPNINSRSEDPIKVGAFKMPDGDLSLIAVNLSDESVQLADDQWAAKDWRHLLPKKIDYSFKPYEAAVFTLD
jgi:hypothetical protein